MSNQIYFQQDATLHSLFISGKQLYVFRVLSPPIISSTHNCIDSIWHLSNRYSSNSSTIAAGSSNGLISARCRKCSCVYS
jgi:hypothetical protein